MTQLSLAISLCGGYLSLIQKDSIIHMQDLTVYVKAGLPFVVGLSPVLCKFLFMFSTGLNPFSILCLSSSINFLLHLNARFFMLFDLT